MKNHSEKKNTMVMMKLIVSLNISAMESTASARPKPEEEKDKPPQIADHVKSANVMDGESVTLSCRIIGAKKFDVIWLHNNKEIKPSKDFQYTSEANIHKLQIMEIFPEDSGTYTCEAFNDAGESFSSCTLNVKGKSRTLKKRCSCKSMDAQMWMHKLVINLFCNDFNLIKNFNYPVPNEMPKSPVFTTFPESATVTEGEGVNFTCQTDIPPLKCKQQQA